MKAHMRLPVNIQQQPWSYLARFQRYGDLMAKNHNFSRPSLIQKNKNDQSKLSVKDNAEDKDKDKA